MGKFNPVATFFDETAEPVVLEMVFDTNNISAGSTANNQVALPYSVSGTYTGTINWGDGDVTSNTYANRTHTYASPGVYTIKVYGSVVGFSFGNTGDRLKITSIVDWGDTTINSAYAFYGCENLTLDTVIGKPTITDAYGMFRGCTSLTTISSVDTWNLTGITSLDQMFMGSSFNGPLNWNTTNITSMSSMFASNTSFNQNLSTWDVSNVVNFSSIFSGCTSFNVSLNWNCDAAQNMSSMFRLCTSMNVPQQLNNTYNVTTMYNMFNSCYAFNHNVTLDVASVVDMSFMFFNCYVFNGTLTFNNSIGALTNVVRMFENCFAFNKPINFDTSNVTTMQRFIYPGSVYNQSLATIDVRSCTNFTQAFPSTLSPTNMDATYNAWALLPVQPNQTVDFGGANYTAAGQAGRDTLTNAPNNWTITDGGVI